MPRVIHFEIHADDLERAMKFYKEVFGWKFENWNAPMNYWLITTGKDSEPGINGGIMERQGANPSGDTVPLTSYVCTVDVPDVDMFIEKAKSAGGTMALGKMPIPNVGWLAYMKDTEGNIFGMMQNDSEAA